MNNFLAISALVIPPAIYAMVRVSRTTSTQYISEKTVILVYAMVRVLRTMA